jgi:membrane protein required for colicin V production
VDLTADMTAFDWAAMALVAVSALFGVARGAAREISGLAALILAGVLALGSARVLGPQFARLIHPSWLAEPAGMIAVFLLTYIVLRLAGGVLTRGLRGAGLGGLDRLLGLGVGVVRGVAALGVFALVVGSVFPARSMPGWIGHARLYPLARGTGDVLMSATPGLRGRVDMATAGPVAAPARPSRSLVVVEDPR